MACPAASKKCDRVPIPAPEHHPDAISGDWQAGSAARRGRVQYGQVARGERDYRATIFAAP